MNRVIDLLSGQPSFSYVQAIGMSFLSELIRSLRRGGEADRETNIVLWRQCWIAAAQSKSSSS
ncbi:hypothetical protein HMSSN139_02320 [Paenibacillus sp. HMSSN-139]|nr:hypothetical protein HMSSN139_02320 [Paenibacillus sp. HMSSN-139]